MQSLYAVAIVCFTFAMAYSAWELQNGESITVTGRKKGLKSLFIIIGDLLGITGSVIAGLAILAGFTYYSWKKYQTIKVDRTGYTI